MPNKKPEEAGNFRDTIETLSRSRSSPISVFSDFVRMSACAVACQTREDEYFEVIRNYDQDELQSLCHAFACLVNEMQKKPFSDLLGEYYQTIASKSARDGRGEFYTPEHVSELMARITVNVEEVIAAGKPITVNEPTSGGGGMILQLAKQFSPLRTKQEKNHVDLLRVTAQDLSPVACDITFINTSLWGIPTQVFCGNTLANEFHSGWKNIHWARVGEDKRQAFLEIMSLIQQDPTSDNTDDKASDPSSPITGTQLDFDFGMK